MTKLQGLLVDIDTAARFTVALCFVAPWVVIKMLWRYYPLVLILFTGAVLRIPHLWAPLWYDEQFSLIMARLPMYRMLLATSGDVHPPLSYIVMAPWSLGPDWLIRIPSYFLSLAAIVLFWIAMQELGIPRRAATIAAMFMAVSPFQLFYANEARMYALLQFLVLLALVAGLKRAWWLMALAGICAVYTQNYGVFYMLTVATVLLVRTPRDWWRVATVGAVVFVCWLPWLSVIRMQTSYMTDTGYWIPLATLGNVVQTYYKMITGSGTVMQFAPAGLFAVSLWILSALIWMLKVRPPAWVSVLILAFMPAALSVVVSNVGNIPVLLSRPLIASTPWLFLTLVYPVTELEDAPRRVKLALSVFIVPVMVVGVFGYLVRGDTLRSDNASQVIMDYIKENWQPGDVIYHEQDGSALYFRAFAPAVPQFSYPPCKRVGAYISPVTRQAMGIVSKPLSEIEAKRIWLIVYRFPYTPQCELDEIDQASADGKFVMAIQEDNANANFFDRVLYLLER